MSGGSSYFSTWFSRVDKTQSGKPHWITPVATISSRLEEEVRNNHDAVFTVRFAF
jgi:hypothetical protein